MNQTRHRTVQMVRRYIRNSGLFCNNSLRSYWLQRAYAFASFWTISPASPRPR